ncbi:MAG: hypothetical protein AVDCRST_MAG87-3673 [uncultured Thermomicrobiales bacterium]|uniref:Uncharacterized protein n=1 Tax=uncultured Thermomicrobiales bacterium TaxID=1645740 RepID=A0A6J4VPD8_9BACT|nr:MAG: hypothetical protein AVDCRST_MAG87-3673 [uncultured Thermomicrobiales bacterium]
MTESGHANSTHHPLPIRRLLAIACVMAAGIAGLWILIDRFSDVDMDAPTPPPATDSPIATPTADGIVPPRAGSLAGLLGYVPDLLADDALPLADVAWYADIDQWMTARSLAAPVTPDESAMGAWRAELASLALTATFAEHGLDQAWRDAYGFDLTQVHQVLVAGQAPDYVTILRGGFDREALYDAWVASGYQAVEAEGATIWTLFPGDTIDLSNPASRPAMGMLNNVVLLEDGTLVGAAKLPRLRSALRVANGSAPSLADNAMVASLIGPATNSGDLVSAVISRGRLFQAMPSDVPESAVPRPAPPTLGHMLRSLADEAALAAGMPEVVLALTGIPPPAPETRDATPAVATPRASPDHPMRLLLAFDNRDDARSARRVIEQRFQEHRSPVTGSAYGERYGTTRVRVLDVPGDPALVAIDASLQRGTGDWLVMLAERDAGFAFWLDPDIANDD